MHECFHCGKRTVIWDSDFNYEDYGLGGNGIVQEYHCTNCGVQITYWIDCDNAEIEEKEQTGG